MTMLGCYFELTFDYPNLDNLDCAVKVLSVPCNIKKCICTVKTV